MQIVFFFFFFIFFFFCQNLIYNINLIKKPNIKKICCEVGLVCLWDKLYVYYKKKMRILEIS